MRSQISGHIYLVGATFIKAGQASLEPPAASSPTLVDLQVYEGDNSMMPPNSYLDSREPDYDTTVTHVNYGYAGEGTLPAQSESKAWHGATDAAVELHGHIIEFSPICAAPGTDDGSAWYPPAMRLQATTSAAAV